MGGLMIVIILLELLSNSYFWKLQVNGKIF